MTALIHSRFLTLAAAGALVALTANLPAGAEEPLTKMGPVGPNEPILASVGSRRIVAFYVPDNGNCGLQAVVWEASNDPSGEPRSAERVQVSLKPQQMIRIDGDKNQSLDLRCGDEASTLAVVDSSKQVAFGARE
ncbi:hypothetical protein [Methyloceanibacter sp.]|uniref:hypothetical protein n=1 Tax=Methyloceanibacter sp. TaxID=1965321 RepID=UPI003D6D3C82